MASLSTARQALRRRQTILARMADVGLGYVKFGQPLTTLSGGERQRLKLAVRWQKRPASTSSTNPPVACTWPMSTSCWSMLDGLVDSGKSVIVIEHHQAVMAHADWIIDLGPGAGHDGGRVVFEGTPADLVANARTLTGKHLAAYAGT